MKNIELYGTLAQAAEGAIGHVQRSLAMVHNGQLGAGAGILWRLGGYILTNQHVVDRESIRVTLADGRETPARVLARKPEMDLALIKIEEPDLPVALLADSRNLKVGQIVFAVGHPWGQWGVVTCGIISGIETATIRNKQLPIPIIRSDVTLAPGNSGGPLVNAVGGVIGINTMIVGGDLGIAIPSHVADDFVTQALDERMKM